MATLRLSSKAVEHPERIFEFMRIREAIKVLEDHPLIGRTGKDGLRELVISHWSERVSRLVSLGSGEGTRNGPWDP
jgi:hypothetical protein